MVRAIMAARLAALSRGYSGVAPATVTLMVELLNRGIHPVVRQQGSLGASGDLAPLSHLALPLIGEGEVTVRGRRQPAARALAEAGLAPVELGYKEGLALVNGTSASTAVACTALHRAERLLDVAVLLASVTVQCLRGSTRPYEPVGHALKGHPGQMAVADRMRALLAGSSLTRDHTTIMAAIRDGASDQVRDSGIYLQDAYTLRCVPQILGPVADTLRVCRGTLQTELNSCNDNPLILDTAEGTFHGGNFHAQYTAMAADFLGIALCELGVLAERQVNRLLDPALNGDLPDFLALTTAGWRAG